MTTIAIITPRVQDFNNLERSGNFGKNIKLIHVYTMEQAVGRTFDGYFDYLDSYNVVDYDDIREQVKLRVR
ncbi:MAG: hypothetical protein COB15_09630 [Flavobacteriales bacterium]|nr:MAG: hypothetical protein COB15_09630 [Flavobacteriales bacterium]